MKLVARIIFWFSLGNDVPFLTFATCLDRGFASRTGKLVLTIYVRVRIQLT